MELGKVNDREPVESLSETEKLAVYLKYANDEKRKDYVKEILATEEITMAENVYRKLTQDEIEYERMKERLKYQLQYNTDMSQARKKGNAHGFEQGLEQVRSEGEAAVRWEMKHELDRTMKAEGEPINKISKYTGLDDDEIRKL